MKLGSLFDGIGGFPLAGIRNGFTPVWASEIERVPIEITKKHFPDMKHLGDVTQIKGAEIEPVDVITFGSPCFPAGTLVTTNKGYVPIEGVQVGDFVLTHTGKWQKVLRTGSKKSKTVTIKGFGHYGLRTTANHPFYASTKERKWNNLRRSYDRYMSKPKWLSAKNMQGKYWGTIIDTCPLKVPIIEKINNKVRMIPEMNHASFWWMVGRWLGDGWVRIGQRSQRPSGEKWGQIFICSAYNEADELLGKLNETGLKWAVFEERTTVKFRTNNKSLANWLVENFSYGAQNKTIPAWIISLPKEFRQAMLDGYFSADGWRRKDGTFSASTVSKKLALGISWIATSLGYSAPVYFQKFSKTKILEGRTINQNDCYTVRSAKIKQHTSKTEAYGISWGLVRDVRQNPDSEQVYNLEVENDNSYVAENIIVHNCQDLSIAGKGAGLDGERSGLFLHAIRIIRQMRDATDGLYPRFAIWENVPGAFSSNDRQDFRRVLAELAEAEVPMPRSGKWANSGMVRVQDRSIAWRTYDSQYWGVPQRRKRIYLVTDFRGECGPEILFKPESLRGDFEASGAAREEVAGDVRNGASSKSVDTYNLSISETHHTLRSEATGTDFACAVVAFNSSTSEADNMPVMEDVAPPLRTVCRNAVAVFDRAQITSKQNATRVEVGLPAPSIASTNQLCVLHPQVTGTICASGAGTNRPAGQGNETDLVIALQGNGIDRADTAGCNGAGFKENVSYALNTVDRHAVAFAQNQRDEVRDLGDKAACLSSQPGMKQQTFLASFQGFGDYSIISNYQVRRLTPLECERLQGFPDNWTVGHSDSARYKAIGNSVTVTIPECILGNVADEIERSS